MIVLTLHTEALLHLIDDCAYSADDYRSKGVCALFAAEMTGDLTAYDKYQAIVREMSSGACSAYAILYLRRAPSALFQFAFVVVSVAWCGLLFPWHAVVG